MLKEVKNSKSKKNFCDALVRLFLSVKGQTLAEYGILLLLIALIVISSMALFGKSIYGLYDNFIATAFGG